MTCRIDCVQRNRREVFFDWNQGARAGFLSGMRLLIVFLFGVALAPAAGGYGQMTPNAPVRNFKVPNFGENGYTQWVLEGGKGIYDSEAQVRVEAMALRLYSGDARMALEMELESPKATLRLQESRAFSAAPIRITGSSFEIEGRGWSWTGADKEIIVEHDAVVAFAQALADGLREAEEPDRRTRIESERLQLTTTESEYRFRFSDSVVAHSGGMRLQSGHLLALADMAADTGRAAPKIAEGQLDAIHYVLAEEAVVIKEGDRTIRAEEAEFYPRDERIQLMGKAEVELPGALMSGARILSRSGRVLIEGSDSAGRAQMILARAGGLGIAGAGERGTETIVLADSIVMREGPDDNEFDFRGRVEVMSGALQLRSERMAIVASKAGSAMGGDDAPVTVGPVRSITATGAVRIERDGQVATGERVRFYPENNRAELEGEPVVTDGEARVSGVRMRLGPGRILVRGSADTPVTVELPQLPDLGYAAFESAAPDADDGGTREGDFTPERVRTEIRSRLLEMVDEGAETRFRFTDAVEVNATNLTAGCGVMEVFAARKNGGDGRRMGTDVAIRRIEAEDAVHIRQRGREATAEQAVIRPAAGTVVLEGNAVVKDEGGTVSGQRMTLNRGQRRAVVEGGEAPGERARITLPAMPGDGS